MLEEAIPEHLVQERTRPVSTPPNHEPALPAYGARFPQRTKDLVMAIMGAQFSSASDDDGSAISKLMGHINCSLDRLRPSFWELASVTDNSGAYNIAVIAYWPNKMLHSEWAASSNFQQWWDELNAEDERHGWFLEVFFPTIERFETVFSDNEIPEGAAHMREGMSGPIKQHLYFGSMRDRLPVAQTDALIGETGRIPNKPAGDTSRRRLRVRGRQNLTVIRSGQDWSDTDPKERKLYLETMHPVLIKGMEFLRDHGDQVGCYSCRFMDVVDPVSHKVDKDKTFGLAYFDELNSLERWSKQHKTHLDIFGGLLQYAKVLDGNMALRLFHEVLVLTPEQQWFEYIGCHEKTGMLVSSTDI
ncbi:hypothetical protein EPUS_07980 [Endocarpon pusillum Z07020]|uniref:Phenylacetaldoxime dehydratase n=1 Tax=Endocarpon pusillum (strain Z07020 / HMAS-L-300199) TaxID=1263415 RepID=U1HNF8_ENDPU|nr:uncharacterized protein EPUS_07980 [Endocarpon pusillum Z07020]ERF70559.1 hypothetical protein EPUS_07980 [Endocarpon pusillum Z07020]